MATGIRCHFQHEVLAALLNLPNAYSVNHLAQNRSAIPAVACGVDRNEHPGIPLPQVISLK